MAACVCVYSVYNVYGSCIGVGMCDYVHVDVRRGCWAPSITIPLPPSPVKRSLIELAARLAANKSHWFPCLYFTEQGLYVQPPSPLCGFWRLHLDIHVYTMSDLSCWAIYQLLELSKECVCCVCISTCLCFSYPSLKLLKQCFNILHMWTCPSLELLK